MGAAADLRARLAERYPDAMPLRYVTTPGVATGVAKLDALLPGGGLPRGRLTVWRPGGGATAVLRAACGNVVRRGERAAWIALEEWVPGDFWPGSPLLLRPAGEKQAAECAEELSRCGGFGLVVLCGGEVKGPLAIRLGRAVRAGGGALVVLSRDTEQAQLCIDSRYAIADWHWVMDPFGDPADPRTVTIRVQAWSAGWSGRTELKTLVLGHEHRVAAEALTDRRGTKRRWLKEPGSWSGQPTRNR